MGQYLDSVPFSGIIRIRDMMYSVKDPFRLDQGDVSFEAPESVKTGMHRAIDANHSHYVQTTGLPRLLDLLVAKLRNTNGIPVGGPDEVMVTTGGIHALFVVCQALLEPGDEVLIPDPEWPPCGGNILAAQARPVPCPLHESLGWRYDLSELESKITAKTKAIYVNSPHNPTGGVLTAEDVAGIVSLARERNLWLISDEAYEDVIYDGATHVSPASLPGAYAADDPRVHVQQVVRDDGPAARILCREGCEAARANEENPLLYRQQRHLDRATWRDRRARRTAGPHRAVSRRAARHAAIFSIRVSLTTRLECCPAHPRGVPSTRS